MPSRLRVLVLAAVVLAGPGLFAALDGPRPASPPSVGRIQHGDLSLRTFFRPNDGEAYFRRQLERAEGP